MKAFHFLQLVGSENRKKPSLGGGTYTSKHLKEGVRGFDGWQKYLCMRGTYLRRVGVGEGEVMEMDFSIYIEFKHKARSLTPAACGLWMTEAAHEVKWDGCC